MASKSTFYGGNNAFIRGVDKNVSELIQAEVKKSLSSLQNKLLSLTQRVDLLNTNFHEYKKNVPISIKRELHESKEEILNEMGSLVEKYVNQRVTKETSKKRRKVPRSLTVSCWSGICLGNWMLFVSFPYSLRIYFNIHRFRPM